MEEFALVLSRLRRMLMCWSSDTGEEPARYLRIGLRSCKQTFRKLQQLVQKAVINEGGHSR